MRVIYPNHGLQYTNWPVLSIRPTPVLAVSFWIYELAHHLKYSDVKKMCLIVLLNYSNRLELFPVEKVRMYKMPF